VSAFSRKKKDGVNEAFQHLLQITVGDGAWEGQSRKERASNFYVLARSKNQSTVAEGTFRVTKTDAQSS